MARIGRTTFRDAQLPEVNLFLQDLVGGVDLNAAPTALPAAKAQELRNFSTQEAGALVTLEGWAQFITALLTGSVGGEDRIQGGERIYIGASPITLIAYEGAVYPLPDTGVLGSSLVSGLDDANAIYFVQDTKVVLVLDGANVPQISADATSFYEAGIDAPPSAPTLSAVAGGSLIDTNDYEVSFAFGSSSSFDPELVHEGNESDTDTQTVAGANLTVRVTALGSDDPKVDTVYIYARNVTAGQPVRRRVGSVTNTDGSTNWTFDITTEPSDLAIAPEVDNDPPLAFRYAIFWKGRFWAFHPTIPNRLHFSKLFAPQAWPSDYYLDLSLEKGDALAAMVPMGDLLTILTQTGIHLLSGATPLDYDIRPALSVETGAFGPRAACKVEAGIMHAGAPGVFLFNGAEDQPVSKDIATGWRAMVQGQETADLARIAVMYLPRLSHLKVAVPDLYPIGAPGEYILDLVRTKQRGHEVWFKSNRAIGGYIPWFGNEPTTGDYGRVLTWTPATGLVNEENLGFTADGDPLTAVYITAAHTTQFRETNIINGFFEYQPADGTLQVDLFVNDQLISSQNFILNAAVAAYGDVEYGAATYGSAGRQKIPIVFPLPADGTVFFLRFTFQGTSRFKLFSYGFGTLPEPVIRTLR